MDIFIAYKNQGNIDFENGSTKDEVASVLGTPNSIIYNAAGETIREIWGYKGSTVSFSPLGIVNGIAKSSSGN